MGVESCRRTMESKRDGCRDVTFSGPRSGLSHTPEMCIPLACFTDDDRSLCDAALQSRILALRNSRSMMQMHHGDHAPEDAERMVPLTEQLEYSARTTSDSATLLSIPSFR